MRATLALAGRKLLEEAGAGVTNVVEGEMEDRVFGLIVNEYKDMIHVYVWSLVRDQVAAEDLTQDTFVAAYEAIGKGTEVRSLPAWLRGIARNLAAKAIMRKQRERALMPDAIAVERVVECFDRAELGDTWAERLHALRECRQRLPGHQKRAVNMRYDEGLRVPAIVEKTGWMTATVYQVLWAARKFLKDCVKRRLSGELGTT